MMTRLQTIENIVHNVLQENPAARDNDMELYWLTAKQCLGNDADMPAFETVMRHYGEYGIPCFESVRRTRQAVQKKYPELGCSPRARRARHRGEEAYRKYARDNAREIDTGGGDEYGGKENGRDPV